MPAYIVAPEADQDVFEIWRYLAEHAGIDVAERVERELCAAFESLAAQPELGHRRADLTSGDVFFFKLYSVSNHLPPPPPNRDRWRASCEAESASAVARPRPRRMNAR